MGIGDFDPNTDDSVKQLLGVMGARLNAFMPEGYGFALFIVETSREDGQTLYISSLNREDFLTSLRRFLDVNDPTPTGPTDADSTQQS